MKKEELEKEVSALLAESIALEQSSALELKTAQFLSAEGNRLMSLVESSHGTYDEQELNMKKLESIIGKIEFEQRMLGKDDVRMKHIQDRLKVLNMLCANGLIEE